VIQQCNRAIGAMRARQILEAKLPASRPAAATWSWQVSKQRPNHNRQPGCKFGAIANQVSQLMDAEARLHKHPGAHLRLCSVVAKCSVVRFNPLKPALTPPPGSTIVRNALGEGSRDVRHAWQEGVNWGWQRTGPTSGRLPDSAEGLPEEVCTSLPHNGRPNNPSRQSVGHRRTEFCHSGFLCALTPASPLCSGHRAAGTSCPALATQ
jgi:hypothetical protein